MPKNLKSIVNSRIRGFILKTVELGKPFPVGDDVINDCLTQSGVFLSPAELSSFIDYLKDRGYIDTQQAAPRELAISSNRRLLIRLTSKGVDVLEGIIDDPAIKTDGGA